MTKANTHQRVLLSPTFFCDHEHPRIESLSRTLEDQTETPEEYVKKVFFYVRDTIRFGIDLWQIKASGTLLKGYGACYNKNLLMIALLRNRSIPCRFRAYPMTNSFIRPSAGNAYKTLSNPFFHCFTDVLMDDKRISLDPTLDKRTYEAFFKPLELGWSINWDDNGMKPLYSESISGPPVTFTDIDTALKTNLNSYFLFKYEPNILLQLYAGFGNKKMWEKAGLLPSSSDAD
jgi:transglutaminase-like putative cysteine protease